MYQIDSHLLEIPLKHLRPTQMTVGFKEVDAKRKEWEKLGSKGRRKAMAEELFPVVKGPGRAFYILDHHHTAVALVHARADSIQAGLVKDLSELTRQAFWTFLDHYGWMHVYDQHGKRRTFADIPTRFEDLQDDPYRSLAGAVRDAGGFAKVDEPFLEFLWANYFRVHVAPGLLKADAEKALKKALRLAPSKGASHLPGWSGKR